MGGHWVDGPKEDRVGGDEVGRVTELENREALVEVPAGLPKTQVVVKGQHLGRRILLGMYLIKTYKHHASLSLYGLCDYIWPYHIVAYLWVACYGCVIKG